MKRNVAMLHCTAVGLLSATLIGCATTKRSNDEKRKEHVLRCGWRTIYNAARTELSPDYRAMLNAG